MHDIHPDTHTDGFSDECARCQKYITNPNDLDAENMRRIWRGEFHTRTDVKVYDALYRAAVIAQNIEEAFRWEGHTIDNPPPKDISGMKIRCDLFAVGGRA
jgi:hypothetical protein